MDKKIVKRIQTLQAWISIETKKIEKNLNSIKMKVEKFKQEMKQ